MKMQAVWVAACAMKTDRIALELLQNGLDPTLPSLMASAVFYGSTKLIIELASKGGAPGNSFHECINGYMALWLIETFGVDPFTKNPRGQVLCQDRVLVKKGHCRPDRIRRNV